MRRGRLLTGLVFLSVSGLPALLCLGQTVVADPFTGGVKDGVTAIAAAPFFRGQPLVEQAVKIDDALRKITGADYFDTRLGDVLDEFSNEFEIPILIHTSTEGNDLNPETIITIQLANVPLHSMLELILEKHNCTIAIHNDVLQIVSNDAAKELMEKRIYDCSTLIERATNKDQLATLEKLQDMLTRTIDPDSWEISGGNAQVSEFAGKLVISQTLSNHLAIERLLGGLYDQLK